MQELERAQLESLPIILPMGRGETARYVERYLYPKYDAVSDALTTMIDFADHKVQGLEHSAADMSTKAVASATLLTIFLPAFFLNGQEAAARFLADGAQYDLILMNVQMPIRDGYQATGAIRRSGRPKAQSIPIIAMTADAFHEDVVRAGEAGMNAHCPSPLTPSACIRSLSRTSPKRSEH